MLTFRVAFDLMPTLPHILRYNAAMPFDSASPCANFRDVGLFVNLIAGQPLIAEGRLFRGGRLDAVRDPVQIGSPASIINLRRGADYQRFGVDYYHFPISNDFEKYDTSTREVRRWLNDIVQLFESDEFHFPVMLHCTAGKDRTGVVVAALLKIAGVPEAVIVQEYLLSEGEINEAWIRQALDGIGDLPRYFHHVKDLEKVARRVRGDEQV